MEKKELNLEYVSDKEPNNECYMWVFHLLCLPSFAKNY